MNRRGLVGGYLVIVCLAILWGVWDQRGQLASLRAEQQQLLAQMAARADGPMTAGTAEASGASSGTPQPTLVATPELLRLRGEVTRLTDRRRELVGVRAENERLRVQLASRGTNGPAGLQLPPGYVRKGEARMVGYSTPEDTMQSLLWALHSHNLTNLLQVLTPKQAEGMRDRVRHSNQAIEDFFQGVDVIPGMAIHSRKQLADGSVELAVEMVPGLPFPPIRMQQIGGEWKLDMAL